MKKPTETPLISTKTIERDLKALLQSEDDAITNLEQDEPAPTIDFKEALQLFDELRARSRKRKQLADAKWTHRSVINLGAEDPVQEIIARARTVVLDAIERGWKGPPYNPFILAEMNSIALEPTDSVLEAQTRYRSEGQFVIDFNPSRPVARMRYSIAHELGHILFPDCKLETRHRATHTEMKDDDWQLESLCNIAAAEILMPFGTLQEQLSIRPSIDRIRDLRRKYAVSYEAVANRLIRLTTYPCCAFLARRDDRSSRYLVEYRIASPALRADHSISRGCVLPGSSRASACTAIGATDQEDAKWVAKGAPWFIEYLGISSNTGESNPRVLGIAFPPPSETEMLADSVRVLPGDASEPFGADAKLVLQVVNDRAQIWGGGFAKQVRKKWPHAQESFRKWAYERRNLTLGNIHSTDVRPDLKIVSLIAQHGFGGTKTGPRLRYGALYSCLQKVAELARQHSASIHMPRIGAGGAGGNWQLIEGIVRETLSSNGCQVTIYDLPSRSSDPIQQFLEFPQEMVDEAL